MTVSDYVSRLEQAMAEFGRVCAAPPVGQLNVTIAQMHILFCLGRCDGQKMSELAKSFTVTLGNMTGIVNRLVRDKLVRRVHDSKDRRIIRVFLTRGGRKLESRLIAHKKKMMARVVNLIPVQERAKLLEIIERITGLMSKEKEKK
jgi:DNA-binding MarR family transcriptional regulator